MLVSRLSTQEPLLRTYSNHSPVLLLVEVGQHRAALFMWHFPPHSLLDAAFRYYLAKAVKKYFQVNIVSVPHFISVFQVYIRGIARAKQAGVLKSIRVRLALLEQEIAQLEREHSATEDKQVLSQIHEKLTEFNNIALSEVQHMGKYASAHEYGQGECAGVTLAGVMCPNRQRDPILEVQGEDDILIKDPVKINWFCEYYTSLYTAKITPDIDAIADYLTQITMPLQILTE
ncbi:hypothetical protein NDU88_007934 [Pleurodeles waltl]|uniref:Uncharacterized protein n=1 Tax=Pleurodeles waltl TaxID=8319 RepID=A0AAV7RSD0_PLEWA|nr:hypothetical protein NDU88_007934 [Pleurodeles waltl]